MKLSKILFILTFAAAILSAVPALAGTEADENAEQTYGLLCSAGVLDYHENFDYNAVVAKESFAEIYSAYFNEAPAADGEAVLNANAVYNLAKHCRASENPEHKITDFKDFGLIGKEYREAYKMMCSNGYLNFEKEFLLPADELKYGDFLHMLSFFGNNFAQNQDITLIGGTVTNASSQNNIITISVSSNSKITDLKFKRDEEFTVYKDFVTAPYSYNIKRGDNARFYMKSGKIIYAAVARVKDKQLTDDFDIFKSSIYLYNSSKNQIIFKNLGSKDYTVFNIDSDTLIYRRTEEKSLSEINTMFLDIECCVIADKNTGTVKYINISGI